MTSKRRSPRLTQLIAALFAVLSIANAAMSDTATSNVVGPAAISAHEYKLVLKPNKFKGVKPDEGNNTIHDWKMLSKRWDAIRESAKDLGPISTKAKARHVEFFDSNRLLQKNNIILRQ